MIQQFQIVFFSCQKVTLSNFHAILLKKTNRCSLTIKQKYRNKSYQLLKSKFRM